MITLRVLFNRLPRIISNGTQSSFWQSGTGLLAVLEAVSKPIPAWCEPFCAKDCSCQFVKGLKVGSRFLITKFESSEVAEPAQCALNDISGFAQPASVWGRFAARSQQRFDAQHADECRQDGKTVASIPLEDLGFNSWPTAPSGNRRHGYQHLQRDPIVTRVGWSGPHDQRQTPRIGQDMPFTTLFRTVRRVLAGMAPPKTARTLALSITARERWTFPACPSTERINVCSFDQTDSRVQSANRRQHVLPLPQFISRGRACHGTPVLSTNTIPVSACRFETRGRPPFGDGLGSGGNRGSICFHNSSETSTAMRMPPCFTWQRNITWLQQVLK